MISYIGSWIWIYIILLADIQGSTIQDCYICAFVTLLVAIQDSNYSSTVITYTRKESTNVSSDESSAVLIVSCGRDVDNSLTSARDSLSTRSRADPHHPLCVGMTISSVMSLSR